MIYTIDIYVMLFLIYSFAGWTMETVRGVLKTKKFVNRGFMIGPYCPVYGVGVTLITLLLNKYIDDIPALFFLAILICGTLEYFTSYIMEKCFNARWWDYSKKRFNINGRICLETLLPFGILGTLIIKFVNPFIISKLNLLPFKILNILTCVLSVLFIIDFIVSYVIINGFKKTVYESGDNTEEISKMVKEETEEVVDKIIDKTEDILMKVESDAIVFSRRLKVSGLKFERKVHRYTSKKLSQVLKYNPVEFIEKLKYNKKLLEYKIREDKEELDNKIKARKEEINNKLKETKDNVNQIVEKAKNDIRLKTNISDEKLRLIREKMINKSILHKRLMDAFPDLKTINKKDNK